MPKTRRTLPVLLVSSLLLGASGTAVAMGLGDFTIALDSGLVSVEQGAIIDAGGGVEIAYQTMEFVPGAALGMPLPDLAPVEDAVASIVGRDGLTFTAAEVEVWRDRSVNGPFRDRHDAWENSPGDWDRMVRNAEGYFASPGAANWAGPRTDGTCVRKLDPDPLFNAATGLRDAAFLTMVTGDDRYKATVRASLLWHARQGSLNFENQAIWCPGNLGDINPGFWVAAFMTQMLFSYDYLGPDAFTQGERDRLDAWFLGSGRYFQTELDDFLSSYYTVRDFDQHVLDPFWIVEHPSCEKVGWEASPDICRIHRSYNNRRASMARHMAAVGAQYDDASLLESSRLFASEYIKYSVYPDGTIGELERWRSDLPDLGWAYAGQTIGAVITIADLLARNGDPSVYKLVTSQGALGSQGGSKSLLFASKTLGRYIDGTYVRYGTDDRAKAVKANLIDGVHLDWHGLHDISVVVANRFYQDPYLEKMYTRTGAGMKPMPSRPASNGPNSVFAGEFGVLPGVLFMYAGLEDLPYPGR